MCSPKESKLLCLIGPSRSLTTAREKIVEEEEEEVEREKRGRKGGIEKTKGKPAKVPAK